MHSSNFAIASCSLLFGSASLCIDSTHAFLTPQPLTQRQCYTHQDVMNTSPSVLRIPSSLSVGSKVKESNNLDFESKQSSSSSDKEEFVGMDVAIDKLMSEVDLISIDEAKELEDESTKWVLIGGTVMVVLAAGALAVTMGNDLGLDLELGQLIKDPSTSFDIILKSLETMDAQKGMLYFSSFYVLAEILAIPAVPILTASSGYLFGTLAGTATCLFSAAVAASISFVIGRTLLRGYVEKVLDGNPKFKSMDRAIEKEGFKLMLLLRLSPLFPFALSNYLYGASSIQFLPYFFGTLLGFAPGTFAYVYAGRIGKALTMDAATSEPWYVYVGGLAVVVALLKIAGDVATGFIDSMEEDDEGGWEGDMEL
jgi:uncharacterized membrane protein YdjX (TVP38/TMEM64 family)